MSRPCKCGWVKGATTGYPKLTKAERDALEAGGCEIDLNVHGEEVARRLPSPYYNTARFELHRVICRPTAWERLGKEPLP